MGGKWGNDLIDEGLWGFGLSENAKRRDKKEETIGTHET